MPKGERLTDKDTLSCFFPCVFMNHLSSVHIYTQQHSEVCFLLLIQKVLKNTCEKSYYKLSLTLSGFIHHYCSLSKRNSTDRKKHIFVHIVLKTQKKHLFISQGKLPVKRCFRISCRKVSFHAINGCLVLNSR